MAVVGVSENSDVDNHELYIYTQSRYNRLLVSVVHVAEVSTAAEAMMPVTRPLCFAQKLTNVQGSSSH